MDQRADFKIKFLLGRYRAVFNRKPMLGDAPGGLDHVSSAQFYAYLTKKRLRLGTPTELRLFLEELKKKEEGRLRQLTGPSGYDIPLVAFSDPCRYEENGLPQYLQLIGQILRETKKRRRDWPVGTNFFVVKEV